MFVRTQDGPIVDGSSASFELTASPNDQAMVRIVAKAAAEEPRYEFLGEYKGRERAAEVEKLLLEAQATDSTFTMPQS